jgi:hypothetical protein
MRTQAPAPGLLLATLAVLAGGTRVSAKEPPPAPCAPACQAGETCVSGTCMVPTGRASEAPPPPPAFPPPPGGALATPVPPPYPPYAVYQPPPPGFYLPPPRSPRQRRFLILPYIGTHTYQSAANSAYFPGFRIGGLVGGRVSEVLSLNWELTLDVANVDNPPTTKSSSEFAFDFGFSPTIHLPAGAAELLLGPKLGVFWVHTDIHDPATYNSEGRQGTGILGGVNAGAFMSVSANVSLGLLLSFEFRKIEHGCAANADEIALCDLARDRAATVFGLTAAALFR